MFITKEINIDVNMFGANSTESGKAPKSIDDFMDIYNDFCKTIADPAMITGRYFAEFLPYTNFPIA